MTSLSINVAPAERIRPEAKIGFGEDIEHETKHNSDFRRVLYTGKNLQLVLMLIPPGEESGDETHEGHDQFFRIEKGQGEVWSDGHCSMIKSNDVIIVPAGAKHHIVNTGDKPMKLYTIYAPPEHRDAVVHATRSDADMADQHFDGRTTE